MGDKALLLLRRRLEQLDASPLPVLSFEADERLAHFAAVMASYTDAMVMAESGGQIVLAPADADQAVGDCRLLDDIARDEDDLVSGPLRMERQHWIATARQLSPPKRAHFVEPIDRERISPSTKPFYLGLYTSTATHTGKSMWRTHLDFFHGSDLYPLPWQTWKLHATGSVLEISCARAWVDFVQTYAERHAGLIYPNWTEVAKHYDGVHLTLRAIAATQGFTFATTSGITAAPFWDVESTLWLRWRFTSIDFVEVAT